MAKAQRIAETTPIEIPAGYELVDGVLYMYEGPSGNPRTPPACEEKDGFWYPYEEGAHVVHGAEHFLTLERWINMVTGLLIDWPKVGIYSDVYVYYRPRQKRKYAPDLYVLPEVRPVSEPRTSIFLWEEPSPMVFVMEVLSTKTEENDRGDKFNAYQNRYKVPEYLLCDPRGKTPTLEAYRLKRRRYTPIAPDSRGRIWSEQLQGWFGVNDAGEVQLWNAAGEPVPAMKQAIRRMQQAEREAEASRRWAEEQAKRAEEQRTRANRESQLREDERRFREAAEARQRELEEELNRLRKQ